MFKFIFDLITEPLGLPIEWYYEWIILGIIGVIAYNLAYDEVGQLYRGDLISGKAAGSFFHWIIRTFYFVVIWAFTYGVIWIGKFVISHKVQFCIGAAIFVFVAIIIRLIIWIIEKNKFKRVKVRKEKETLNENRTRQNHK